jgi:hypothetical protein
MMTLCLGGPLDGKLTDQEYPHFAVRVGATEGFTRNEIYRLEKFGWGADFMWVYLHEFMNERVAMDALFGTRATGSVD